MGKERRKRSWRAGWRRCSSKSGRKIATWPGCRMWKQSRSCSTITWSMSTEFYSFFSFLKMKKKSEKMVKKWHSSLRFLFRNELESIKTDQPIDIQVLLDEVDEVKATVQQLQEQYDALKDVHSSAKAKENKADTNYRAMKQQGQDEIKQQDLIMVRILLPIDQSIDSSIQWLIDWLIDGLIDWFDWLIDLIDWLIDLIDWLIWLMGVSRAIFKHWVVPSRRRSRNCKDQRRRSRSLREKSRRGKRNWKQSKWPLRYGCCRNLTFFLGKSFHFAVSFFD